MDEYQYYSSDDGEHREILNILEVSLDSDDENDHGVQILRPHLPPRYVHLNEQDFGHGEEGPGGGLIHPGLLEMIHRHQDRGEMLHRTARPEVLETWLYNWQTKERKIPEALVVADKAIKHIEKAFQHLKDFHANLYLVSADLQPSSLIAVDKLAYKAILSYSGIIRELEEKINAIRLFWFPETVEQFKVGAYKSVRQYVQDMLIDQIDMDILVCSTCLEPMRTSFRSGVQSFDDHEELNDAEIIPVVFRRRCQINPLLLRQCDLQPCRCILPSICLNCALDHLLKNGLHEGKTSVRCPACRGEVCIYDIQEINLIVKQPPPKVTSEKRKVRNKPETPGMIGGMESIDTFGGEETKETNNPPAVSARIRELNNLVSALRRDLEKYKQAEHEVEVFENEKSQSGSEEEDKDGK